MGSPFSWGACAAATLPPVDLTPLLVVAFPGLLWLDDGSSGPRASFGLGYAFGFGFFLAGLYWIAGALFVDIATFWWLVPIVAVGLPAAFALYVGMALLAINLATKHLRLPATAEIFGFAIAWTAAEWVRGHAFTGLPWNLIGYTWSGGFPGAIAMLQSVAWIGIYGLSFVTVLAASLPALLGASSLVPISAGRRWAPAIAAAFSLFILGVAGAVRLRTIADGCQRDLATHRSALDSPNDEMGAGRCRSKFSAASRSEHRTGNPPDRRHRLAGGRNTFSPRARCDASRGDRRHRARAEATSLPARCGQTRRRAR